MCLSIEIRRPNDVLGKGTHLGFEWRVTHNQIGYRCGYVRVPKGHPWHGKEYGDIDCDVHGGLTFAEADVPCGKGKPDDAWWIGFDCAHSGDAPDPSLCSSVANRHIATLMTSMGSEHIRGQEYLERECRQLCEQACEASKRQKHIEPQPGLAPGSTMSAWVPE